MTPSIRPSILLLAVTATLGLAACGGDSIDTGEIEQTVVAQFEDQGVAVTDTQCDDVEAEVGAAVRCTAFNPQRTKLIIEGKVTAIEDGKARFEAVAVRGEASGKVVAAEARKLLEAEVGQPARAMTCPEAITMPTTRPVRCTLTVAGGTRYGVDVSIDGKGKINAEVDTEPVT